jgi:hypothetical protein
MDHGDLFLATSKAGKREIFRAFVGDVTKGINANWRADKTIAEFSAYNPIIRTPEDYERQLRQANLQRFGAGESNYMVTLKLNKLRKPDSRSGKQVYGTGEHHKQLVEI